MLSFPMSVKHRTVKSQVLINITWWRHQMETFPRYWPFVRGIHWSPVNSPHKGQWRRTLMFSLIYPWTCWTNNWIKNTRDAGYDVIIIWNCGQGYCPCNQTKDQSDKSQNAPVSYPIMHYSEQKCAHFCSEWHIVGYGTGAFCEFGLFHDHAMTFRITITMTS